MGIGIWCTTEHVTITEFGNGWYRCSMPQQAIEQAL
jgi:hypothetical protein